MSPTTIEKIVIISSCYNCTYCHFGTASEHYICLAKHYDMGREEQLAERIRTQPFPPWCPQDDAKQENAQDPQTIELIVKAAVRQVREKEVKPMMEAAGLIATWVWVSEVDIDGQKALKALSAAAIAVRQHQTLTDSPAWLHEIQVEAKK